MIKFIEDIFLRVYEYIDSKGISHPITDEWLSQFNQK